MFPITLLLPLLLLPGAAFGQFQGPAAPYAGSTNAAGGAPSGPAGGVLSGTYPNPGFASTTGSGATVLATGATLSGGTLSGTTTLPGSGAVTSGGSLYIGSAAALTVASVSNQGIQLASTGGTSRVTNVRYANDAFGPASFFAKSRASSVGGFAAAQSGDGLGESRYVGDDGTTLNTIAAIFRAEVDGVVSAGDVPGRFIWQVKPIGAGIAERMRLTATGLGIRNANPQAMLSVGTSAGTALVYNSFTDASNGEWAYLGSWGPTANVSTFGTAHNGSGVARDVSLIYDGTERIRLVTGGVNLPSLPSDATHTDNTVCADTSTGLLYKGSGAVGICLGTSSARFKHDIAPLRPGLAQIMALQPVSYRYNKGYGDDGARELYGFTAEQVAEVLPKLVGHDAEGHPNSVDWAGMVPVLVRAIQELKEGR
jgi:hypothetical protein